eukprot:364982-Chlamydomonas_euryale.AAC.4
MPTGAASAALLGASALSMSGKDAEEAVSSSLIGSVAVWTSAVEAATTKAALVPFAPSLRKCGGAARPGVITTTSAADVGITMPELSLPAGALAGSTHVGMHWTSLTCRK